MPGFAGLFNGTSTLLLAVPFGWISPGHSPGILVVKSKLMRIFLGSGSSKMSGCVAATCAGGCRRVMPVGQFILSRPAEVLVCQNLVLASRIFVLITRL